MHGFGGGMGGGWLIWIVLIGMVIWVVYTIVNKNQQQSTTTSPQEKDAIEILKERYAKGDISKEEYESKKRDLEE